jgi:HEAT repeat protein
MAVMFALALAILPSFLGGASPAPAAAQQAAPPDARFVAVQGSGLASRLSAALSQGRASSNASRFWAAYSFEVRSGVTIDYEYSDGKGHTVISNGVTFSVDGTKRETKNLGVFLLYDKGSDAPSRVELFNLDRKRDYSGYPVYWLGRAEGGESLELLEKLIQSSSSDRVTEGAVAAAAVHADVRADDLLERTLRTAKSQEARKTAAIWIGMVTDRLALLGDAVRDEAQPVEVRKQAAIALGISPSSSSIAMLRGLYGDVKNRDVREQVIVATAIHGQEHQAADDEAVDFLIRVADTETDHEMKRQAIFWLSQKAGQRSLGAIESHLDDPETDIQEHAVFALSQRPADEAIPALIRVAKEHHNPDVRRKAIFWLGQSDDPRAFEFIKDLLGK